MICSDDKNIKLHRFTGHFFGLYCRYWDTFDHKILQTAKTAIINSALKDPRMEALLSVMDKKRDFIHRNFSL